MRVARMILVAAVLAGSTAAASAKGGPATNPPPGSQKSVRAGDSVPDRSSNRPHKNHHKNNGAVCANGTGQNGKSGNCAATVSPQ